MVYLKTNNMKKIILIFLLLISITSFSQVDTTGKRIAKEAWLSNLDNLNRPIPTWDNDGNIIGFMAILLLLASYSKLSIYKKNDFLTIK
jgi:hypothetical protein